MNCKSCRVEIEESDIAKPRSVEACAHLESCEACASFRAEQLTLARMIGGLKVVAAPADFDFRLRARLAALKSDRHGQVMPNRFSPGAWSLAIVAAFVVIIMIGLIVRQSNVLPVLDKGRANTVKTDENKVNIPSAPTQTSNSTENLASSNPLARVIVSKPYGSRETMSAASSKIRVDVGKDSEEITSVDLGSTATANTVLPPGIPDPIFLSGSAVAIPVRAATHPTTIEINSEGNEAQSISVRAVTFGGQELFEGRKVRGPFVSTVQGVW